MSTTAPLLSTSSSEEEGAVHGLRVVDRAVDHPDMTENLAEILSTPAVDVEYRVETGVTVD